MASASEDSFVNQLAAAQQRRRDLLENGGLTEEEARLAAREEAMGDYDPHADEASPIWHLLSNIIGALMLGLGLGFFVVSISEPRADGKSAVDDPSALVPLIFGVTGFFLFFASIKWLYTDHTMGRLSHLFDSCNPNAGPKAHSPLAYITHVSQDQMLFTPRPTNLLAPTLKSEMEV